MQWLRKIGTHETFQRNPVLALRTDMEAITQEQRDEHYKQLVKAQKLARDARRQGEQMTAKAEKAPTDYNAMPEDELRQKAAELKLAVPSEMPLDELRTLVKATVVEDAEHTKAKQPVVSVPKTEADQPEKRKPGRPPKVAAEVVADAKE